MPTTSKKPVAQATDNNKLHLQHLAGFATFLLENKLKEFAIQNIVENRMADFHLAKHFDFIAEDKLVDMMMVTETEFLQAAVSHTLDEYIKTGLQKWKDNLLPLIARNEVSSADITMLSFMRKKQMLCFLPGYTNDITESLAVVGDIDKYVLTRETAAVTTFSEIQDEELNTINSRLQRSQNQLLEAQELAGMGSFDWDMVGKESSYSPQVAKIMGLENGAEFQSFLNDVLPDDKKILQDAIRESTESDGLCECEFRYNKNGKEKVIWLRAIVSVQNGRAYRMSGTIFDITERLRVIERLQQSEERYYKMVAEVKDYSILLLNKEGRIENWNRGAGNLKGYEAHEAIGQSFSIFYTPEDRLKHIPEYLLKEAMTEGQATHEGWKVKKDGTLFWGNAVLTALHNDENELIGFSKVTRDLTEKKNAEDRLRKYAHRLELKNKELENINKELESFTYIASHDLQEPLRNIKIFIARLIEKETDTLSDKGKFLFDKIHAATGRMQKLIEDLLAFSRTQTFADDFAPVDLNNTLNEIKASYSEAILEKKLTLNVAELPVVNGIAFQFYQLFDNIIANSIKYSKPDVPTQVSITWETVKGEIVDGGEPGKSYFKISMADNGIGFESKYASRIFEIFQRLHGRDEYSGTGIGLAICKKIVQNHDGFIYAEGRPDEGATFYIYLPAT